MSLKIGYIYWDTKTKFKKDCLLTTPKSIIDPLKSLYTLKLISSIVTIIKQVEILNRLKARQIKSHHSIKRKKVLFYHRRQ